MPNFSHKSLARLETCDSRLQVVFLEVVKHFDCTVLTGHRDEETQNEKYRNGLSKVQWPNSKHNQEPSNAVDVAPYPIDWEDTERFRYFAGYVMGIASMMGIRLRHGGDWDGDTEVKDNRFNDLPHFELVED